MCRVEVADADSAATIISDAIDNFGRIDAVVNSAGHGPKGKLLEISDDEWHLGMEVEGSHPLDAGFDEHLGIASNYEKKRGAGHSTLYRGREVEAEKIPFQALTKRYTDEAVSFIKRQRDEPFFLFFSQAPLSVTRRTTNLFKF